MINKCAFIGRLGSDVSVKYTQSGTAVANFSIACSEKFKDKDGNQHENTEWVNVVAWKRLAEICGEYLLKGSLVYVEGKMQTRSYDDKDGNKKYTTEIVAREMKMLSGKNDNRGGQQHEPKSNGGAQVLDSDDEVPL